MPATIPSAGITRFRFSGSATPERHPLSPYQWPGILAPRNEQTLRARAPGVKGLNQTASNSHHGCRA